VGTTGAGPVCNRNWVPAGDGRLATQLCPGGLGARGASALSPLVAAGSHDFMGR
jgi:hypothetical protein